MGGAGPAGRSDPGRGLSSVATGPMGRHPLRVETMSEGARRSAWIAGGAAIVFSGAIWLLAQSQNTEPAPPDVVPRALASATLLGAPGLLGWIGAWTSRRVVLAAAGVLCLFQSAISFSGATLIYLMPAVILLRAAMAGSDVSPRKPIRMGRVVIAAVLSVPLALMMILSVGLLGVLLAVLIAGLAAGRDSENGGPALTPSDALRGLSLVILVIAAWAATLALTETACWIATAAGDGGLAWERIAPTDTLELGDGIVASTCAGGTPTAPGVVVAAVLLVGALAVAALPLPSPSPGRMPSTELR